MLALRLFLPESWTSNRARLDRAGVPAEYRTARTKPELALVEIDRAIAAGVRFGCVLADAGYGLSAPFRQGLTARKLAWAVGIPRHLKVYPADVRMICPVAKRGRPRQRHVPDILSIPAEDMLTNAKWRTISWRTGTKGKLKARFAAVRVRVADGPPQRIRDKGQQHLPGDEAWLIGEHRMSGEKKYYLANLPARTNLRTLAATIKARWICEQAHQQMKEELGLDHFEGRSWQGLHRHALMTMIAYAFLQHRRLATARRKKKESMGRRLSQLCPPYATPSSNSSLHNRRSDVPIVENGFATSGRVSRSAKVVLGCVKTWRCGEQIEWTFRQITIRVMRILKRGQFRSIRERSFFSFSSFRGFHTAWVISCRSTMSGLLSASPKLTDIATSNECGGHRINAARMVPASSRR